MTYLWSYLLVFIAAFFNAFMDTVENQVSFNASIFNNWDKKFWCKEISWQYAKKILGFHPDGWHFAKSFMIICLALAVILYKSCYSIWFDFIGIGVIWNGAFVIFYWLFKSKTWK